MKRLFRIILLPLVLLRLTTLGITPGDPSSDILPIHPLWEPNWSPVGLVSRDFPVDAGEADIDGDGRDNLVILGLERIYKFSLDGDSANLYYLQLSDRFRDSGDSLANDSDPDMDNLTVFSVGTPQCGTTEIINSATAVRYCTEGCFDPPDEITFSYTITDGFGRLDSAQVTVAMPDGPILFFVPPAPPEDD